METKRCTLCGEEKPLSDFGPRSDRPGGLGVRSRCRICERKKWREFNSRRFREDPQRRKYLYDAANKRRKEKGYGNIHLKTEKAIKKMSLRPDKCPICGNSGRIIAHHVDYSERNKIAFCCGQCHAAIHRGEITDYKIINLKSTK